MPQKIHSLLIFICVIVLSCKEDKQITFTETNITTENNSIVEINVPKAKGSETLANNINSEIENTIKDLIQFSELSAEALSVEEAINNFNKEFEGFKTDFPDLQISWEAQIDGEVVYQSEEIISLAITSYIFTGGAHGMSNVSFLNFNAENGQVLSNEQLINDVDGFKQLAQSYFNQTIVEKEHSIFDTDEFVLPYNMAYTEDGLVLLYNTYEIAPYSTGIIEFKIPFEEAAPFLVFNHF